MKLSSAMHDNARGVAALQPRSPSHTFVNQPHKAKDKEPINLMKNSAFVQDNLYDYQQIVQRVNELTNQLDKLDEVIRVQSDEIEHLRAENASIRRGSTNLRSDQYPDEISILRRNLEILESEKQQQQDQYAQQLKQYQEMIFKLESVIKRQQSDSSPAKNSQNMRFQDIEDQLSKCKTENMQLTRCINNKNQEIDYLTSQLQELSEQLSCKGIQGNENLIKQNNQLQQQINYLQEQFISQVDQLEDKIKIVLKENDRLQQLKQNIPTLGSKQLSELINSFEKLSSSPENNDQQSSAYRQNLYLKEQLQHILQEFQLLKDAYDSANNQIINDENNKQKMNNEMAKLQNQIDREELATQQIKSQLCKTVEEKTSLDYEIKQSRTQMTQLQKQNELLKLQVIEMGDINQQKQAIIDKLTEYCEKLNTQLGDRRSHNSNQEAEHSKLVCKLQTFERENKYLQGQCQNHKNNRKKILQQFNEATKASIGNQNEADKVKSQLMIMLKNLEKSS